MHDRGHVTIDPSTPIMPGRGLQNANPSPLAGGVPLTHTREGTISTAEDVMMELCVLALNKKLCLRRLAIGEANTLFFHNTAVPIMVLDIVSYFPMYGDIKHSITRIDIILRVCFARTEAKASRHQNIEVVSITFLCFTDISCRTRSISPTLTASAETTADTSPCPRGARPRWKAPPEAVVALCLILFIAHQKLREKKRVPVQSTYCQVLYRGVADIYMYILPVHT